MKYVQDIIEEYNFELSRKLNDYSLEKLENSNKEELLFFIKKLSKCVERFKKRYLFNILDKIELLSDNKLFNKIIELEEENRELKTFLDIKNKL